MNTNTEILLNHFNHGLTNVYGVECFFKESKNLVSYIVEVTYKAVEESDYLLKLTKKRCFINKLEPKSQIDVLAQRCADVIYPIVFQISAFGILTKEKVVNFEEIKQRWKSTLKELKREFKGDYCKQYFAQMEASFRTEEVFYENIKNDFLYALFFLSFPALYSKHQTKKGLVIKLPVVAYNDPVSFVGTQKSVFTNKKVYELYFKGIDYENNTLEIEQLIDRESFVLAKVKAIYNALKEDGITITITMLKERQIREVLKEKKKNWFNIFKK